MLVDMVGGGGASARGGVGVGVGAGTRVGRPLWRARAGVLMGVLAETGAAAGGGAGGGTDLSFAELSLQRGINYIVGAPFAQIGAGQGLLDLDGDGHLDIVILGASNGLVGVYKNTGSGSFMNRSFSTGIAPMTAPSGFSACDYDADGDLDLFLGGWFVSNRLLRNNGNLTFTDVTAQAGLTLAGPSMASAWSDFDADGWVDLYVCLRTGTNADTTRNKLYRNLGDGSFVDVAVSAGVDAGEDPTLLAAFFDMDRDGDDDLYLGTDKGDSPDISDWTNRLFRNDQGGFTEITAQAGAEANLDCMGIAVGDLDFNGFFDLYLTNLITGNLLLMNDGAGHFTDQTVASGMGAFAYTWGTVFADFNDDTHLDTYVCADSVPNFLYEGSSAWPMTDVAAQAGVATPGLSYSVAVGDVDTDGDLDLLVSEINSRVKLYINTSVHANHALRLEVAGQGANTHAIGAQLDITAAGLAQARQVQAGSNYKCLNEFTVHVGLGGAESAESVVVRWPGTGDTRTLTNAPCDERWTIYPPERLGDANGNGRLDRFDVFITLNQMTGPGVHIAPGQEIMDMDGDFDIDLTDIDILRKLAPPLTLPTFRVP